MAEVARDDRSPTVGGSNTLSMDVEVVDGMVPKHEFDRAIEAAQQALRAKTASSQQMLAQASSAMRNALTALSLSEQEVANLKATVKELQERPAEGTNEIIEREREELRQAQQRVADLSSAFRQLQGEVARVRYEQEGFDMPVAMSLPVKIAPELASRVTVIAQLVMLGYSYEDGEMALDAIRVNDLHLALEWLEGRHATKSQFSINQRRAAELDDETKARRITNTTEEATQDRTRSHKPRPAAPARALRAPPTPTQGPDRVEEVRVVARSGAKAAVMRQRSMMSTYDARKRAVSSMICMAIKPPGVAQGMTKEDSEAIAQRCIEGLARLAHKSSAFMILTLGGNRCAFDCLKLYETNPDVVVAAFKLMRALESNMSTMMHIKKQQRFRLLPNAISHATGLHAGEIDIVGEGAHALWASNTLGGKLAQERCKSSGFLRYVKTSLNDLKIKEKDPNAKYRHKIVGMLLSLANGNKTMQNFLVNEGYRAMIRKTLTENPSLSFAGEFSSLKDWIKEEYESPSFAPDDETPKARTPGGRDANESNDKQSKKPKDDREKKVIEQQQRASALRSHMAARGITKEGIYFAKKRVIMMLCKIALNPPGSVAGVSKAESEEIAYRSLLALARITEKGCAYLVLTCGGPRTAVDCLRYYLYNPDMMYACMRVLRALLTDPSTMMRLMKQVRFKILPSAIMDAVVRHSDDLEMKAEAAHALWAYTGVGGKFAQQNVMDCGPQVMDFLKEGLSQARADVGSNQYVSTIRKFLGCILSLAKDNKEIQDQLVERGLRSDVRKALSENQGISFHGEFGSLRDWIRGDRGGAKSTSRSNPVSRTERNAAESALESGTQEDSQLSNDHIKAQKLFAQASEDESALTPAPKVRTSAQNQEEDERQRSRPDRAETAPKVRTSAQNQEEDERQRSRPDRAETAPKVRTSAQNQEEDERQRSRPDRAETAPKVRTSAQNQEEDERQRSRPDRAETAPKARTSAQNQGQDERQRSSLNDANSSLQAIHSQSGLDAFDTRGAESKSAKQDEVDDGKQMSALQRNFYGENLHQSGEGKSSHLRSKQPSFGEVKERSKHEWTINEAISVLKARDSRMHVEASEALANMFYEEPTVGIAIVLNGGLAALAHAITIGDATFCTGACALIHMLTSSNLTLKRCQSDASVISGDMFKAILDAMSKSSSNIELQQWGATAIWALVKENHRAKVAFMLVKTNQGESSLRVLKNALKDFGAESEGITRAVIGCTLALALNSVPSQKAISDLAMPYLMLDILAKHPQISFRGEFDNLREWLRDNSSRKEEVHRDVSFNERHSKKD